MGSALLNNNNYNSNNNNTVIGEGNEGKTEVFYLTMHSTHLVTCIRHMVKDHSDSESGNPLPSDELLLTISCKGSFISTIPQTG